MIVYLVSNNTYTKHRGLYLQMLMACSINMYNNCSTSIYQALDQYWGSIPGGLYTLAPAGRHLQSPVWVRSFPTYEEYTIYSQFFFLLSIFLLTPREFRNLLKLRRDSQVSRFPLWELFLSWTDQIAESWPGSLSQWETIGIYIYNRTT